MQVHGDYSCLSFCTRPQGIDLTADTWVGLLNHEAAWTQHGWWQLQQWGCPCKCVGWRQDFSFYAYLLRQPKPQSWQTSWQQIISADLSGGQRRNLDFLWSKPLMTVAASKLTRSFVLQWKPSTGLCLKWGHVPSNQDASYDLTLPATWKSVQNHPWNDDTSFNTVSGVSDHLLDLDAQIFLNSMDADRNLDDPFSTTRSGCATKCESVYYIYTHFGS